MPIKTTISNARVPIKIWSDMEHVEQKAVAQLINTANLPFVFKHVAAMPDVHYGIGATVGTVIATKGAICPAAVGVDIGCGMMAVKTPLEARVVQERIAKIRHSIERSVPVGQGENRRLEKTVEQWHGWHDWQKMPYQDLTKKALAQLGSLGSGNHFIEICLDTEHNVWVMLHSGSRGVGNVIAKRHIDQAKGVMKQLFMELPDPDLAYFVENTKEFELYYADLMWCQQYAFANRQEMMRRILKDLAYATGDGTPFERLLEVNCHHNYVEREFHFDENVLVTRKGAVRARAGDLGIIPGSMGTKSFIVKGRGNADSFHSCSHGAGRKMSRTEAKSMFTVEDLQHQTAGVECRKDKGVLDEIPSAYKSIDTVMANQTDLVEIVAELKQIMCVKG